MSTTTADEDNRPGFHQRDPAALAAEAGLGPDGHARVAWLQDLYRQFFELVQDKSW